MQVSVGVSPYPAEDASLRLVERTPVTSSEAVTTHPVQELFHQGVPHFQGPNKACLATHCCSHSCNTLSIRNWQWTVSGKKGHVQGERETTKRGLESLNTTIFCLIKRTRFFKDHWWVRRKPLTIFFQYEEKSICTTWDRLRQKTPVSPSQENSSD